MLLSVIVVTYNPGDALKNTIDSILSQTSQEYEVIIKDGGTTDGSLQYAIDLKNDRIKIISTKDQGIYDAMNQAVTYASGDYIIFMNSGDRFYDNNVIKKIVTAGLPKNNTIAYGDTYFESSNSLSKAPSKITGFVCYRNVPCHQAIIYSKDSLSERGFDTSLRIRADFEHFIWSYYDAHRNFVYLDTPICLYEGGGFSEKKSNVKRDKEEYTISVRRHIPAKERFIYRAILILTLYKLRGVIARNPKTAKIYQKIKGMIQ